VKFPIRLKRRSTTDRKSRPASRLTYQSFEPRNLLAGITFANGELTIGGSDQDDTAAVSVSGSTLTASLSGFDSQEFSTSEVTQISFIGLDGDDMFTNGSSIPSSAFGLAGDDTLIGGSGIDVLVGGTGADILRGEDGDDILRGGIAPGDDMLFGGAGNDQIFGSTGSNEIHGGDGDDVIFAADQPDTIFGDAGDDEIFPGHGANTVYGGEGDDHIISGRDIDTIFGEAGNDFVFGGASNDEINGGDGNDRLIGGEGDDTINGGASGSDVRDANDRDLLVGSAGDDILNGDDGANLFIGGDGVDTINGGSDDDIAVGGDGDDIIDTGDGEDTAYGDDGDDTIDVGAGNDNVFGGAGNDTISGGTGDDTISGQRGDDIIDGGTGRDRSDYGRKLDLYDVFGDDHLCVRDTLTDSTSEGDDTLMNIERLKFNDGVIDALPQTDETITIQPIVVSNTNGSNTAEFFGDSEQEQEIKKLIDEIFFQASIDVVWATERSWNNTFANVGNGGTRPADDLFDILDNGAAAGRTSSNALVINMFFVEVVPGTSDAAVSEDQANGRAVDGANGVTFHVGDNLVGFEEGRRAVARVAAHEISHNLGLDHVTNSSNLMFPQVTGTNLTTAQRNQMIDSSFSQ